jgi:hypothetical protein
MSAFALIAAEQWTFQEVRVVPESDIVSPGGNPACSGAVRLDLP